jgi:hypothetical protein
LLNLRSGLTTVLFDDPDGGVRDPQVHYAGNKMIFSYRMNSVTWTCTNRGPSRPVPVNLSLPPRRNPTKPAGGWRTFWLTESPGSRR